MSLAFIAQWDIETFKRQCVEHRDYATEHPITENSQVEDQAYHWEVGPWSCFFELNVAGAKP